MNSDPARVAGARGRRRAARRAQLPRAVPAAGRRRRAAAQ